VNEILSTNFTAATRDFGDLRHYARRVEDLLQREEQERQTELNTLSGEQASLADLFADPFPQVFYASVVVAGCTLLEQHIDGIADTLKCAANLRLKINDLRGSLIERFRKYSADVLHLDFDLSEDDWDEMVGLYRLRNCLVHSAGRVDSTQLREFATRHKIAMEQDRIQLHQDDTVGLLDRTWRFIEAVYAAAMRSLRPNASPIQPTGT